AGDRAGAGQSMTSDDYRSCAFSGAAYRVNSGYCKTANKKVSGTTPKTLKLTHTSVVCERQTISLRIASAKKNSAQRKVSLRQPSSVRWKTESNTIPSNDLPTASPLSSTAPNNTYMMVGLSLMKSASCRGSVSEPNPSTITAVTSGMTGKCRVSAYDTASAATTATMNTAVATKMPVRPPDAMSAGSMGDTSGRNSVGRELARKNSSNGPRSSTSLRSGLS